MALNWKLIWGVINPQVPDVTPRHSKFPKTFKEYENDSRLERPRVFEPSLLHYPNAFRNGEPEFYEANLKDRWLQARRLVLDHLLELIGQSVWANHLVLRGSLLLKMWLGEAAREPGDMDWVVIPKTIKICDNWACDMFKGVRAMVSKSPHVSGITIDVQRAVTDDIWTYSRVPGSRIVFPWQSPGLPEGSVQMDFVFEETLPSPPIESNLLLTDGRNLTILGATKEQSLAWKILWLVTDIHPQGKDLYDAVLLAEHTQLPFEILRDTFDLAGTPLTGIGRLAPDSWKIVDWENFRREYPQVKGTVEDWQARLANALEPTLAAQKHKP